MDAQGAAHAAIECGIWLIAHADDLNRPGTVGGHSP
jgi:hypothetical protein